MPAPKASRRPEIFFDDSGIDIAVSVSGFVGGDLAVGGPDGYVTCFSLSSSTFSFLGGWEGKRGNGGKGGRGEGGGRTFFLLKKFVSLLVFRDKGAGDQGFGCG